MDKGFNRPDFIVRTKSLRDILVDIRKAQLWLSIAAVAAFMASAFFVVKYFVGGDLNPANWNGEQWLMAMLGLGITAIITAAQAFLYASGYKGHAAVIATCVVVFFGLFSEISQSMEREDITVRHRSENSAVFKAALGSISALSNRASSPVKNPYADNLAEAEMKLARCHERLASGKERDCVQSTQRVETYRQLSAETVQQVSGQNQAALQQTIAQAKALEYDEDKHYAMIRLIRNMFGVTGLWASFLFSVIIIGTFEYAFHFVGAYVADHKQALRMLGRESNGALIGSEPSPQIPPEFSPLEIRAKTKRPDALMPSAAGWEDTDAFRMLYPIIEEQVIKGALPPAMDELVGAVSQAVDGHADRLGFDASQLGQQQLRKLAAAIRDKLAADGIITRTPSGTYALPAGTQDSVSRDTGGVAGRGGQDTDDKQRLALLAVQDAIRGGQITEIQTHRGGQLFQWLANNGYGRTNQERSDMIMFILDALSKDGYIVPNPDKGTARNKPDWVIR